MSDNLTESVRISTTTIQNLKEYKKLSGINIGKFIDLAVEEKLKKLKFKAKK